MRTKHILITSAALAALLSIAAVGAAPRYIEEIVIGGGPSDPANGGAEIDASGNLVTTGSVSTGASTAARASLTLPHGAAPSSPSDGDLWTTTAGVHARINGVTTGPLLTTANIPWDTPGAIGATTPNSGSFTTGAFSGDIEMTGSTANFDANGSAGQLQFFHTRNTGNASIRFQPVPEDGTGQALIDFFRSTNTTGYVGFHLRRGNGSGTSIFEVKAGSNPATYLRDNAGGSKFEVDHNSGNVSSSGDATVKGGDANLGEDGVTRGVLTIWDGSGGAAPGCIKIASPNGTIWYLFVEDDGTLKVNGSLPTANSDGTVVGLQF